MKTLVVGASGATGKHLVQQLLDLEISVKVVVRSIENLQTSWKNDSRVSIIETDILDISVDEMANLVKDCDAVASCLGHNLTRKGIWGKPRLLVTDAVILLCNAIIKNEQRDKPVKFILMNTTGNRNKDLNEKISFREKIVIGLVRLLIPPQIDNEKAAEHLRTKIGQNDKNIEWIAVRPDSLINEDNVTNSEIYPSPIRSAIFNAGKTSRINVGNFMARLITEKELWNEWKGQMPVIYNKED